MGDKLVDLTGQQFTKLLVVSMAPRGRIGAREWNCVCNCGKNRIVTTHNLKYNKIIACEDCSRSGLKFVDMVGKKFDKLTVIKRAIKTGVLNDKPYEYWDCLCDCGNSCVFSTPRLTNNAGKACPDCAKKRLSHSTIDLTGQKFDKLTVIGRSDIRISSKNKEVPWNCVCDCGTELIATASQLKKNRNNQCVNCVPKNFNDLTGKSFNRWTVEGYSHRDIHRTIVWNCVCACGTKKKVLGHHLRSGKAKSCGCLMSDFEHNKLIGRLQEEGNVGFNFVFNDYRTGAKERGYVFELTKELFREITLSNCFYCNKSPSRIASRGKGELRVHNQYVCNGIDRKNNDLGYTVDNSVPCCTKCNTAKMAMPYEEFLLWVKSVNDHQNSKLEIKHTDNWAGTLQVALMTAVNGLNALGTEEANKIINSVKKVLNYNP